MDADRQADQQKVDTAVPADRDTFYWDDDLSGFGLKVPKAGSKSYLVQYGMGRRATAAGTQGTWPPASARVEAEGVLRMAAGGTDPQAAAKERERVERDFACAPYAERFLSEFGKPEWRPLTYASAENNMRR